MKLAKAADVVGSDARTAGSTSDHIASDNDAISYHGIPPPPPPVRDDDGRSTRGGGGGGGGGRDKRTRLTLLMKDNHYTTNKNGDGICEGYNWGTCSGNGRCKKQRGQHQCSKCLRSDHGAHQQHLCPNAHGNLDNKKFKGAGKGGKGGKDKGSRAPWKK